METARIQTTKDETFRQELDQLYRQNFQLMYRAAKSVTGNRHDAEDAVQNVFVRLIEGQPSSDFQKNPKAYLCKAAINEGRSMVRSRGRRKLVDEDVSDLEIAADENDNLRESLIDALSELDPDLVATLSLRFDEGYSCKEIAKMLRRTRPGVAMTVLRGRRELKKRMRTQGGTK